MSKAETLSANEIADVMDKTVDTDVTCIMSHQTKGKWHRMEVKIHSVSRKALMIDLIDNPAAGEDIQIDQPIGIAFEID